MLVVFTIAEMSYLVVGLVYNLVRLFLHFISLIKTAWHVILVFPKSKDKLNVQQKRALVKQISCRNCDALYVGEAGRSVRIRKRSMLMQLRLSTLKSQH